MGLLAACAAFVAAPTAAAQPGEGRHCTRDEFNAFLNTLKPVEGRLILGVMPAQASYRIGEPVRISVTSPVSGDLLLMSIDSDGVVFPIFPNAHQAAGGQTTIAATTPLVLPEEGQGFGFETQGPEGASRLIAIVRPAGAKLINLPCASGLTKGVDITLTSETGSSLATAPPPPPLPKIFEGWGYAAFDYVVTPKP